MFNCTLFKLLGTTGFLVSFLGNSHIIFLVLLNECKMNIDRSMMSMFLILNAEKRQRFRNYQRCLNTNTLGIVIHQSRYTALVVSRIISITDVSYATQYSIRKKKLKWFGRLILILHFSTPVRKSDDLRYSC